MNDRDVGVGADRRSRLSGESPMIRAGLVLSFMLSLPT